MDVAQAIGKFVQQLLDMAQASPEGRLFVILFLVGLFGVIDRLISLVRALRARSRSVTETDDEVSNPNTELATALSKLSDALLIFANGFTPVLKVIQETAQNTEAGVAGLSGEAKRRQPVDTALLESQDVMAQALDRLQKSIANIRTKDEAQQQFQELKDYTTTAVKPVHEQVTANGTTLGAIDIKADELLKKVDALPPHLDSLNVKMDNMPVLVQQVYSALVAENKALTEQKTQAEAANVVYKIQVDQLTADLAATTERLRVAESTIAALPKPEPVGEPAKPEGTVA